MAFVIVLFDNGCCCF